MPDEPQTDATDQKPEGANEPDQPEAKTDAPANSGWNNEPDYKAEADKWKRFARKHEDSYKDLKAQLDQQNSLMAKLAEQAGIQLDEGKPDPEKLQAQLAKAQAEAAQRAVEMAIFQQAQQAGLDPNALLDSRTFMNKATAADADLTELIEEAAKDDRYRPAAPKTPPAARSGGNYTGAPPEGRQLTREEAADLARTDLDAFEKARKSGLMQKIGFGR